MSESSDNFGIISESHALRQVLLTVTQVAPTDISVLIVGESGTGKELVANAIHTASTRRDKPMVVVNCGAIPEGILESELFGHEKGSFTGAVGARKGYFEMAHQGTIFLDEIGEMPLSTQVKLLRVLENKDFMRVGGTRLQTVNVRVIAATNKDLTRAVQSGEFREDLYYRLNAIHIRVPPLRERREDILPLVRNISREFSRKNHIEFQGFSETALNVLGNYPWPGNVRELKNIVESMIVLEKGALIDERALSKYLKASDFRGERNLPVATHRSSDQVEREFIYHALIDLKNEIRKLREDLRDSSAFSTSAPKSLPFFSEVIPNTPIVDPVNELDEKIDLGGKTLEEIERFVINRTLDEFGGSKRRAAKSLGISERTLYRKIKEYDLQF